MWTVLIPVRSLPTAKSRLTGATTGPAKHAELVRAIRRDTAAAAAAAAGVARLVVVVDDPAEPTGLPAGPVFTQRTPGLNAGLAEAAAFAAARWPGDSVAALVGDLPALRAAELADALRAAATHPHAFVADADGTGTTLLTAAPGRPLAPRFGSGSAARHAVGAAALPAGPGLRRDVDTPADLSAAVELGIGPATAAVIAESNPPANPSPAVHREQS